MSFLQPSLFYFWLLPLASLPILIHLINLLRHRRVKWAAMSFLMASQKRNRNWVRMKQLLLLLCRVLVIAAIVFMLAGPLLEDQWSKLFGAKKAHHVVLLDDSGSMAERWESTTAFTRAKQVVRRLAERAIVGDAGHRFSLVRFTDAQHGRPPVVSGETVTDEFLMQLEGELNNIEALPLTVGPIEAIQAIGRSITTEEDETLVVYVVSDFRRPQWQGATAIREALVELQDSVANVQLVQCVDREQTNLAITALEPVPGVRATGVELSMEIEVANYGSETVRDVRVRIESRTYDETSSSNGMVGMNDSADVLPVVTIDEIAPQGKARKRFPVVFPRAGDQGVTAQLPADALPADSERFSVIEVASDVRVLIVDGGVGSDDGDYLKLAMQPSARVRTGRRVQIERPEYLRDHSLDPFHTVYLLNIDRLEEPQIGSLETFVRGGGGVVFFASDATRTEFVNQALYRNGEGMFPLPLVSPTALYVERAERVPDIVIEPTHPIFKRMAADEMSIKVFNLVMVDRYYAGPKDWKPADVAETKVIARLRNGEPLVVERKYGKGRFLAVLTTSAPEWNNWARNPTFIPVMLDTQFYSGAARLRDASRQLGEPLTVDLSVEDYQPSVEFVQLHRKPVKPLERKASIDEGDVAKMTAVLDETDSPGVYEARLTRANGEIERRRFALNVPRGESDLARVSRSDLDALLKGVPFDYYDADELIQSPVQQAGFKLGEYWLFFVMLILLLVGEQLLAYSASYHPSRNGGRR